LFGLGGALAAEGGGAEVRLGGGELGEGLGALLGLVERLLGAGGPQRAGAVGGVFSELLQSRRQRPGLDVRGVDAAGAVGIEGGQGGGLPERGGGGLAAGTLLGQGRGGGGAAAGLVPGLGGDTLSQGHGAGAKRGLGGAVRALSAVAGLLGEAIQGVYARALDGAAGGVQGPGGVKLGAERGVERGGGVFVSLGHGPGAGGARRVGGHRLGGVLGLPKALRGGAERGLKLRDGPGALRALGRRAQGLELGRHIGVVDGGDHRLGLGPGPGAQQGQRADQAILEAQGALSRGRRRGGPGREGLGGEGVEGRVGGAGHLDERGAAPGPQRPGLILGRRRGLKRLGGGPVLNPGGGV
jgi:hypothetical protein